MIDAPDSAIAVQYVIGPDEPGTDAPERDRILDKQHACLVAIWRAGMNDLRGIKRGPRGEILRMRRDESRPSAWNAIGRAVGQKGDRVGLINHTMAGPLNSHTEIGRVVGGSGDPALLLRQSGENVTAHQQEQRGTIIHIAYEVCFRRQGRQVARVGLEVTIPPNDAACFEQHAVRLHEAPANGGDRWIAGQARQRGIDRAGRQVAAVAKQKDHTGVRANQAGLARRRVIQQGAGSAGSSRRRHGSRCRCGKRGAGGIDQNQFDLAMILARNEASEIIVSAN